MPTEIISLYLISHLTIYRASAGSGKTYTLTREYIRLLLRNVGYHRRILAVTFTNKATEEMKSRIIRDLYKLATRKDEKYSKDMAKETDISENNLSAVASKALSYLLHDYSQFSVVTIDSFFQRVIRSFAREVGLYAGYEVELDQNSVLDQATNLMLDDMDQNDFLKDWLVEWAKRKIEEGKSWNLKTDVLRLGSEIFSEELQNIEPSQLQKLTDKNELERYRENLLKIVDTYKNYLQRCAQKAISIMEKYGLNADSFSQKQKGLGGYFLKLAERQDTSPNTYVMKALDGVEEWYSKKSPQKIAIEDAYQNGLGDILQNMVTFQKEQARTIATATLILKQINVLGVLCDLMGYVKDYTRDQNLFLLSEASGFLKTIIANSDAPFIYERVGSFYNHFIIDEFQDTSSIQWDNFRPLIANSIASGYQNWIVGDVKQSIYRWRNTDWKILSEKVESDPNLQNVKARNLDKNWRSAPEPVQFNNAFFREAVEQIRLAFLNDENETSDEEFLNCQANLITKAYEDSYQHLPEQQDELKGYVHLRVIADEENADEAWRNQVLEELPRRIEVFQDLGYGLSDIAILVRENKEAQDIADMLFAYRQTHPESRYRYDVLSNESLLIGHSPVVKWLIAVMRYIVKPDDLLNKAYLQYEFQILNLFHDKDSIFEYLNQEIIESGIGYLPVYELSDKLIQQFHLYQDSGQVPFLQAFQDILLQYTRHGSTDIRSFLNWWEDEKDRKCVAMPDNQDAIRLMTIHKSKGLEFDVVIIPFCDWSFCKSGKTLWCCPEEEPFSSMKLLPLKFEQSLRDTFFFKEYLHEKMMLYIDNLNLLYVAFTRTKKVLLITAPQPKKDGFANVKDLIHRVSETMCFEHGALTEKVSKKEETHSEYLHIPIQRSWECVPHITRNSDLFTAGGHSAQIDKGKLLHEIFRNMVTVADLEHCLNTIITEGKLPEAERTHFVDMVRRSLDNPIVHQWFAPGIQVKTEAEILLPDGSIVRPDRIVFNNVEIQVIDYKFGELEIEKHRQQVWRYTEYLREMGYNSVKGFLWYVTLNEVREVK